MFYYLFVLFNYGFVQQSEYESAKGKYPNYVLFNLEKYWDTIAVCNSSHKGWSIHFYDKGVHKYGNILAITDFLDDFPCFNNIYLRFSWTYLESSKEAIA
jgi:hypothetical protein